jgi:hypothetical protein
MMILQSRRQFFICDNNGIQACLPNVIFAHKLYSLLIVPFQVRLIVVVCNSFSVIKMILNTMEAA